VTCSSANRSIVTWAATAYWTTAELAGCDATDVGIPVRSETSARTAAHPGGSPKCTRRKRYISPMVPRTVPDILGLGIKHP